MEVYPETCRVEKHRWDACCDSHMIISCAYLHVLRRTSFILLKRALTITNVLAVCLEEERVFDGWD